MIRRLIVPVGLALSVALVPAAGAVGAASVAAKTPPPPKAGHWLAKKAGSLPGSGTFTLGGSHAVKKLTLRGGSSECSGQVVHVLSAPKVKLLAGAGKSGASEWAVGKVESDTLEGTAVRIKADKKKFTAQLSMAFPQPTGASSSGRLTFRTPVGGLCFITFKMKRA